MATTRWKDNETGSLDKAITLLMDPVELDEKQTRISWENWQFRKVFDEKQSMQLNGRNIQYNMIKCTYDQINAGSRPIEDRTVRKSTFIIVYHNGISVNYIIEQNFNAQKMLRKYYLILEGTK